MDSGRDGTIQVPRDDRPDAVRRVPPTPGSVRQSGPPEEGVNHPFTLAYAEAMTSITSALTIVTGLSGGGPAERAAKASSARPCVSNNSTDVPFEWSEERTQYPWMKPGVALAPGTTMSFSSVMACSICYIDVDGGDDRGHRSSLDQAPEDIGSQIASPCAPRGAQAKCPSTPAQRASPTRHSLHT